MVCCLVLLGQVWIWQKNDPRYWVVLSSLCLIVVNTAVAIRND